MPDRDLSVSFLPHYIWPYKDATAGQRVDPKYEQSTAVPTQGSGSARVHHHRSGYVGEVPGEHTEGHNQIRGGDECETAAAGDMSVYR